MLEVAEQAPHFSNEDYYHHSRIRFWSVCKFIELFYNCPFLLTDDANSPQWKLFKIIEQAINAGDLTAFHVEDMPGPLAFEVEPPRCSFDDDKTYPPLFNAYLHADQILSFLRSPAFYNGLNYENILRMQKEINPTDFKLYVSTLKSWSVLNFIRIIFGERYQGWPSSLSDRRVREFVDLLEGEVATGSLKPLQFVPESSRDNWRFLPIDLIKFVKGYEDWFLTQGLSIIGWVADLFRGIEEDSKQENSSPTKIKTDKVSPKANSNKARWAVRNKQREAARKIAKRLWKQDKTLTIADMIRHDEINKVAPDWSDGTLRDWLKNLAPSNKPGRKPNKK